MLTDTDLTTLSSKLGVLQDSATKGRAATIAGIAFTVGEVNLGTAVAGFVNGRFQSPGKDHLCIAGIPVDLTAGVLGIGASLLGTFGPLDSHVATLSAGSLAAYTYRTTFAYGVNSREKARLEAQQIADAAQKQLTGGNANVVRMDAKNQQTVGAR